MVVAVESAGREDADDVVELGGAGDRNDDAEAREYDGGDRGEDPHECDDPFDPAQAQEERVLLLDRSRDKVPEVELHRDGEALHHEASAARGDPESDAATHGRCAVSLTLAAREADRT